MVISQSDIESGRETFVEELSLRQVSADSASRIFDAWLTYMPMFGHHVIPKVSQPVARTYRLAQEDVLTLAVVLTELAFDFRPTMQDLESRDASIFEPMKTVGDVCYLINDLAKEKDKFTGSVEALDDHNPSAQTINLWLALREMPNQFYTSAFAVKSFIDPQYLPKALKSRKGILGGWHSLSQTNDRIFSNFFEKRQYHFRKIEDLVKSRFSEGDIIELRPRKLIVADYVLERHYAIVASTSGDGSINYLEQKPEFVKPPIRTNLKGFEEYFLREIAVGIHGVWTRTVSE